MTERGYDYAALNPKGYVPMLVLDDGAIITENLAILTLIADREPALGAPGPLGRTRLIEILSFLSSELHAAFKPLRHDASEAEKTTASETVAERLELIDGHINSFGRPVAHGRILSPLRLALKRKLP
jgi:glutathione S-transferase